MAKRHPLRILLTEDNTTNQKLALHLLAKLGYTADVVDNGLKALDRVQQQTYDVILMDVMMPELDGLETTRRLNRLYGKERPRIVAMTANALQGDQAECMAAGMDDYLSKPIQFKRLMQALERCPARGGGAPKAEPSTTTSPSSGTTSLEQPTRSPSSPAPAAESTAPPASPDAGPLEPSPDEPPLFHPPALEKLCESTDAGFVVEMIDDFFKDAPAFIETMRTTRAAGNVPEFRRAAHTLKSHCNNLGGMRMGRLCAELEAHAKAGTLNEQTDAGIDRLEPEWTSLRAELEQARTSYQNR